MLLVRLPQVCFEGALEPLRRCRIGRMYNADLRRAKPTRVDASPESVSCKFCMSALQFRAMRERACTCVQHLHVT